MGYKPNLPGYTLQFADYPGLEVVTRRETVDGFMEIVGLAETLDGVTPEHARPEDLAMIGRLFDRFARVLVSWNLDDQDDQPVPANRKGLGSQDFQLISEIIEGWITAMSKAPPPLPNASSGGTNPADPLEASIPMTSLPSSPVPG